MKNKDLHKWALVAEIIGAIAVVLSIIYLTVEVRSNTNAIQSQTNQGLLELANQSYSQSVEYAELELKARNNWESLSEVERFRFINLRYTSFNIWEQSFNANRNGTLSDEIWQGWDSYYENLICQESVSQVWKEIGAGYGPEFRSHVDEASRIECAQNNL